mmetsp:Transcript_19658/g.26443  ORF Transcript_19658/g.26443 Transcript_19658/m.26443 type:complete len:80 (+) Transcript_19658:234-473(+)
MTSLRISSVAKALLTSCLMTLDLHLSVILQAPVAEALTASLVTLMLDMGPVVSIHHSPKCGGHVHVHAACEGAPPRGVC